jgi:hypothetical protein
MFQDRLVDVPKVVTRIWAEQGVCCSRHLPGECLFGAFARPGKLEMIRMFYPDVVAEIDELEVEVEVAAAGNAPAERHCWGRGVNCGMTADEIEQAKHSLAGTLCEVCTVGWQEAG